MVDTPDTKFNETVHQNTYHNNHIDKKKREQEEFEQAKKEFKKPDTIPSDDITLVRPSEEELKALHENLRQFSIEQVNELFSTFAETGFDIINPNKRRYNHISKKYMIQHGLEEKRRAEWVASGADKMEYLFRDD